MILNHKNKPALILKEIIPNLFFKCLIGEKIEKILMITSKETMDKSDFIQECKEYERFGYDSFPRKFDFYVDKSKWGDVIYTLCYEGEIIFQY